MSFLESEQTLFPRSKDKDELSMRAFKPTVYVAASISHICPKNFSRNWTEPFMTKFIFGPNVVDAKSCQIGAVKSICR